MKLPPSLPTLQVDELERKVKSQQEQLFLTKTELTNTTAELKMRAVQAEGQHTQACCWGLRTRSPMRSPTHPLVSPVLPERLELEKKRSRQSLEDAEHLRFKEVPYQLCHLGFALPVPPVGHGVPKADSWLGFPQQPWAADDSPGRCQTQTLPTGF